MTVSQLLRELSLTPLALPEPDAVVENGYCGDLLSWVMGNAPHGCAWLTIMTNRNIIAVAELLDMACIIVAEDCPVDKEVIALALEQRINLLSGKGSVFELSAGLSGLL